MRRPNKDKPRSKKYAFGYLYERNGYWYYNIRGVRKRTPFAVSQKKQALEYLDYIIEKELYRGRMLYDVVDEFLESRKARKIKPETYEAYCRVFRSVFKRNVQTHDTESIREMIVSFCKDFRGSKTTLHAYMNLTRILFTYAIEQGYCYKNPVQKSMIPSINIDKRVFNKKQIDSILEYLHNTQKTYLYYLIKFITITGVRIKEAMSVKLDDIDDALIKIHGKGDRTRYIPLQLDDELPLVIEMAKTHCSRGQYLFGIYKLSTVKVYLSQLFKELGVSRHHGFHSFRRYAINNMKYNTRISEDLRMHIAGHTKDVQEKHYLVGIDKNIVLKMLRGDRILDGTEEKHSVE